MRSKETLKRIFWQMIAGLSTIIAGVIYVITDTKGYLGVGGTLALFAMTGGALACLDGILDVVSEVKCDPEYKKRWYNIDEEP